jgi:Family of unknown function (DUF6328)
MSASGTGPGGTGPRGQEAHEDEHAKRDRQMIELLNELRIALPGVQILFAFLLTVPFSARWDDLTTFQRDVYFVTLVASMFSVSCLIAPTSAHRLRFHQGDRAWVIESAHRLTVAGLIGLSVAMGTAFLLIADVLFDGARVWVYSAVVWAFIASVWFIRPLVRHAHGGASGPH